MNINTINWKRVGIVGGVVLLLVLLVVFLFIKLGGGQSTSTGGGLFGAAGTRTVSGTAAPTDGDTSGGGSASGSAVPIIFKIADGPVASATFFQTANPTTTLARYVMQDNGHVFDMPMDVPGAAARVISNVTIPGIAGAQWEKQASAAVGQYVDSGIMKTIYLGFPAASSTATTIQPPIIKFLPDGVTSFALSPDGTQVAYLLASGATSVGYIAAFDGSKPVKTFSLPLTQVLLSWPSPTILLAQSKQASGVPGIAFSIQTKTGAVQPLLYTTGLSANANVDFSKVLYQTIAADSSSRQVYAHDVTSGGDTALSFQPAPERCIWSPISNVVVYCAVPLQYVPPNYMDLWHQGTASAPDNIVGYNLNTRVSVVVAGPGGTDGGVRSNIAGMAISPDMRYLLFITKNDRTLWGVRLMQ